MLHVFGIDFALGLAVRRIAFRASKKGFEVNTLERRRESLGGGLAVPVPRPWRVDRPKVLEARRVLREGIGRNTFFLSYYF